MWQMLPKKWLIELVSGGYKVSAGSDGEIVWRYTPWLGDHAAKGAMRPLRRVLQVLIDRFFFFFYLHQLFWNYLERIFWLVNRPKCVEK